MFLFNLGTANVSPNKLTCGQEASQIVQESRKKRIADVQVRLIEATNNLIRTVLDHPSGPKSGATSVVFPLDDFLNDTAFLSSANAPVLTVQDWFGTGSSSWLKFTVPCDGTMESHTKEWSVVQQFIEILAKQDIRVQLLNQFEVPNPSEKMNGASLVDAFNKKGRVPDKKKAADEAVRFIRFGPLSASPKARISADEENVKQVYNVFVQLSWDAKPKTPVAPVAPATAPAAAPTGEEAV
jgi:hypothetical protein